MIVKFYCYHDGTYLGSANFDNDVGICQCSIEINEEVKSEIEDMLFGGEQSGCFRDISFVLEY